MKIYPKFTFIPKRGILPASVVQLLIVLSILVVPSASMSHAGHDDIPEASVASVGELEPRFYARSGQTDATIVLGEDGEPARLYLFSHQTNQPLAATVRVEQLTPELKELTINDTDTSGLYTVGGLADLSSTATLTVEIESDDTFDVLSFNNILRPEESSASSVPLATIAESVQSVIPSYMIVGLLAVNALVALLLIAVFLKFLVTRRSQRTSNHTTLMLLICLMTSVASENQVSAHAGDTHGGEGLASVGTAAAGIGGRHFVTVETQLRGGIETTAVQELQVPESFPALGRVTTRPDKVAAITAPADGMLLSATDRVNVPIAGDQVQQNDPLLQLQMIIPAEDKVTISSEMVLAEADLNQATQETQLAAQELERAVRLGSYVSQSEVDKLKTQFQVAREKETGLRSRIATLNAALQGETSGVKTLDIRAPISGIISESHSTLGEYVNAGKALFRIVNIDDVFVEADIFESDMRAIENAKRARIFVEAYPDRSFVGELHSLSPEIDPLRRTAKAVFTVNNEDNLLKSGMFTRVSIETGDPRPVLVVPKTAIVSQDYIKQIYVKVGPELYDALPVTVGGYIDQFAIIEAGAVEEGEIVVIQGQYQVRMSPVVGVVE